jgi:protein TonB
MIKALFGLAIGLFAFSVQAQLPSTSSGIPGCFDKSESPVPGNMVHPVYPKDALRKGTEGSVIARVVVAANSKTKDISVLEGDASFARNAVTAIRKWHFQAITVHDQPVETNYRVHVRFNALLQEAISDVELESPKVEPPPVIVHARTNLSGVDEPVHSVSVPGVVPPHQLYAPEPEFSEAARKKQVQGTVNIALVVGVDGLAKDLRVACSSTPDLIENALGAVKQWKFAPATKDGKAVPVEILVSVSLELYKSAGAQSH